MASLDIQSTWSKQQIQEEIEKTTHSISVIDQELDDLFSERVNLEERVLNLSSLPNELTNVSNRSQQMSSKIHNASISGNEISKQVSQLDIAQTRIQKVLFQVTLMLDLKETIKKVEECINNNKYDIAAQQTYRILHENKENMHDHHDIDEVSYEILQDLEQRLTKLIMQKCKNAQYDNKVSEVYKYCSLYQYLGADMKVQGLDIYCSAIKKELTLELEQKNLTLDSQVKDSIINYVSIIEGYIDMIFTSITQNELELKNKFTDCYPMQHLVTILHVETDLSLSKLLNHYLKTNEIDVLVSKISAYNQNKMQHSNNEDLIEKFTEMNEVCTIQVLDKILDEISHISQELMAYDMTMRELTNEELSDINSEQQIKKETERMFRMSKIGMIRTRLTGDYIMFEEFNMIYQIYRVLIEANQHIEQPENETKTNIKVEISGNIYYLLKTLAIRSFNTYDVNVSCAAINNICNSLESIYKQWCDHKLRAQPGQRDVTNIAQQLYRSTRALSKFDDRNHLNEWKTILLLNTISESISDTFLITKQLEEEMNEIFADVCEKDKFKIRQTLSGFQDICKSFERIVDRGLTLYSNGFEQMFSLSLNRFKQYDFEIVDEKQFKQRQNGNSGESVAGDNESFVDVLVQSSQPIFSALSQKLTKTNFDRILIKMLAYYLGELERFVLNHKFTFWGGMQFDKNRQELKSYFNQLTTTTTTFGHQFIRIRCIAQILQFSNVNEAVDYLNDDVYITNATDQAFTVDEIKKILALRVEFNQNHIQQLKL